MSPMGSSHPKSMVALDVPIVLQNAVNNEQSDDVCVL